MGTHSTSVAEQGGGKWRWDCVGWGCGKGRGGYVSRANAVAAGTKHSVTENEGESKAFMQVFGPRR